MSRRLSMPVVTAPWCARAVGPMVASALALACVTVAPAAAVAAAPSASAPTFALSSAQASGAMRLRATPGQTVRGAVDVRNVSSRRITVRLQAADIRNAANGNADYVATSPSAAGRWVDLAAGSVRLAPGAARRVAFRVAVPADAAGASHYAGVVAFDAADLTRATASKKKKSKRPSFSFARINRQALPITVRLPGPRERSLALKSTKLDVKPAGAGLILGLRPGGTVLTQSAQVTLRVSRGPRTILKHDAALGQLFPGSGLDYRVPWVGRPTKGDYRVTGVIRPKGAASVRIDRTVTFTPAKAKELKRVTPPVATEPGTTTVPAWVWVGAAMTAGLLLGLSVAIVRLKRRFRALAA